MFAAGQSRCWGRKQASGLLSTLSSKERETHFSSRPCPVWEAARRRPLDPWDEREEKDGRKQAVPKQVDPSALLVCPRSPSVFCELQGCKCLLPSAAGDRAVWSCHQPSVLLGSLCSHVTPGEPRPGGAQACLRTITSLSLLPGHWPAAFLRPDVSQA